MIKCDNIPGYPGYFVSKSGSIYCRKLRGSTKGTFCDWYKLKLSINHGYYHVNLWDGKGNCKHFKVHRLVAKAYLPNPDHLPVVCHRDNNRLNNTVKNLYWGTYLENNLQCIAEGRGNRSHGIHHWSHKRKGESYPNSKVADRKALYEDYISNKYTQSELAMKYGVSQGAISKNILKYKQTINF